MYPLELHKSSWMFYNFIVIMIAGSVLFTWTPQYNNSDTCTTLVTPLQVL